MMRTSSSRRRNTNGRRNNNNNNNSSMIFNQLLLLLFGGMIFVVVGMPSLLILLPMVRATATTTTTTSSRSGTDGANDDVVVVTVGEAQYRPPYSQYGPQLGSILERAPIRPTPIPPPIIVDDKEKKKKKYNYFDVEDNSIQWVNWCIELGDAHSATLAHVGDDNTSRGGSTTIDDDNDDDLGIPYRLELTINAYKEAALYLDNFNVVVGAPSVLDDNNENDDYIMYILYLKAIVSFRLGEVYFTDPTLQYLPNSIEQYKTSVRWFDELRSRNRNRNRRRRMGEQQQQRSETTTHADRSNWRSQPPTIDIVMIDKGYADAMGKVGMTLLVKVNNDPRYAVLLSILTNAHSSDDSSINTGSTLHGGMSPVQLEATMQYMMMNDDGNDMMVDESQYDQVLNMIMGGTDADVGDDIDKSSSFTGKGMKLAYDDMIEQMDEISTSLDESISIYRQYLDNNDDEHDKSSPWSSSGLLSPQDRYEFQSAIALAYSQAATCVTTLPGGSEPRNLIRSKDLLLKALNVHTKDLIPTAMYRYDTQTLESSKTAVADLYFSLSDIYIQLGDYERTKAYYGRAMEWHERHKIPPRGYVTGGSNNGGGDDLSNQYLDESIQLYFDQLEEYRRFSHGGGAPLKKKKDAETATLYDQGRMDSDTDNDGTLYYMERDDTFEGSVLASIGSLYLFKVDNDEDYSYDEESSVDKAIHYIERAIELYGGTNNDITDNDYNDDNHVKASATTTATTTANEDAIAYARINLATAYFRKGRFDDSKRAHSMAIDWYRSFYGDGVNPYTQKAVVSQEEKGSSDNYNTGRDKSSVDRTFTASANNRKDNDDEDGPQSIDVDQFLRTTGDGSDNVTHSSYFDDIEDEL